MARLGNYPIDRTLSRTDKFLGTNADGTTRNFTVNGVREFFSQDSSAGASDELNYKFKSTTTNTVGIMSTSGNTDFNSISTIKIHEKANGLTSSVSSFFSEFTSKDIIIIDTENLNNYGVYTVTAVNADTSNNGLYDLSMIYRSGNGSLVNDQFYSILLFAGAQDLSFEFAQASAASTWTVNHNLGKFPSVTVKLADGTVGQAAISHTNKNTLTITFGADTSGTAYMN